MQSSNDNLPEPFSGQELLYFEQQVNDRYKAASAPDIRDELLPENNRALPLAWVRYPAPDVKLIGSPSGQELVRDDTVMMPVHPLDEALYRADDLVRSGFIRFSASYRTVAYEPEPAGPFFAQVSEDQLLMIKLHLENPLPGIPGDRRLPRQKIERCVTLSTLLPGELEGDPFADDLLIVPEFLGASHPDRGVLFRSLPRHGAVPAFSLYSKDRNSDTEATIIDGWLRQRFGSDSAGAAQSLGRNLARPLIRAVLAGFRAGFSLEMHGQNTLLSLGDKCLIDKVHFRDLEGVILSNRFRASKGLAPLFSGVEDPELFQPGIAMQDWFNRNLDHDLGRIFAGSIASLRGSGYFNDRDCTSAIKAIRKESRLAAEEAGLGALNRGGRWLPFSRAPWGNGLRPGHYFRTTFR